MRAKAGGRKRSGGGAESPREVWSRAGTEARRKHGAELTVVLGYPNSHGVAMASLGYQIVYRLLSRLPEVLCLRAFNPGSPSRGIFRTQDLQRPVSDADWLAFSVSYENDYLHLLGMLDAAGLPLLARERDAEHPLVVVGGIAPSLNPEPLAPFVDLIVIGEAEEALPSLVRAFLDLRRRGVDRRELLTALAALEGVYVPSLYEPEYGEEGLLTGFKALAGAPSRVKKLHVADLDPYPGISEAVAVDSEFRDLVLVEVGRGCGRGCRFCAAGFFYRPVRHRGYDSIIELATGEMAAGHRIGLLGPSVFDHPDLRRIAETLGERGCSFSVSSLRADKLDPAVLEAMAAGGLQTVTLAPETGSEGLRRVIGKRITDDQILSAVTAVVSAGIPHVKLYFMIGLPGESRQDCRGIVELVKRARHAMLAVARGRGTMGHLAVSLSCFVPKAWTPFQWHGFAGERELQERLRLVARELGRVPNVRLTHDVPKWAYVQALLARGDRRAGNILAAAFRRGDWKQALREAVVNPDFLVCRERSEDELLPWDFIDTGVRKGYLWREYRAALDAAREDNRA